MAPPTTKRAGALRPLLVMGLILALQTGSLPVAQAVHENLTLQVKPEMKRNPDLTQHELTATVSPAPVGIIEVNFEIVSGRNARQGGEPSDEIADFTRPDFTCTVRANETSCTTVYADAGPPGDPTDRIVAWIDHEPAATVTSLDGIDMNEFHDAGGPGEPGVADGGPGDIAEPDGTDVVLKHWGQLQVGKIPFIDGHLAFASEDCRTAHARSDGIVVARVRVCDYLFAMDPGVEEDLEFDHYASWVQSTARLRSGWCARRLTVIAKPPQGAELLATASFPEEEVRRRRARRAAMTLDAGGTAFEPSYVEASGLVYRGTIAADTSAGQVVTWRGRTRRRVAIPVGVAFAAPAGSNLDFDESDVRFRAVRC